MRPILADVELPQVQEIRTYDRRDLAEHNPPGRDGSLLQDLGRRPMALVVTGMASGPAAAETVERLKTTLQAGDPVSFTADIVEGTELDTVVLDDLQVRELAGKPQRYAYALTLREFIEPAEPEDASLLDGSILDDAAGLIDDLAEGLDLALGFATGLEQFVPPLTDFLARLTQFRDDIS